VKSHPPKKRRALFCCYLFMNCAISRLAARYLCLSSGFMYAYQRFCMNLTRHRMGVGCRWYLCFAMCVALPAWHGGPCDYLPPLLFGGGSISIVRYAMVCVGMSGPVCGRYIRGIVTVGSRCCGLVRLVLGR
jgi:hypothetical protein